jgi:hypothetical protein
MLLLISSYRAGGLFDPRQRATTVAGLLGLTYAGLDLYGLSHLGVLQSLSAVNAFYFGKSILAGICVAMFTSIVWPWPRSAKILLRISLVMFIGLNIYAIAHYDLRRFAPSIRMFCSANGWLIGISVPPAIFLWLTYKKSRDKRTQAA